jgi:Low affinity iron permease
VGKRPSPTRRRRLSIFDRFAEAASEFASHAVFFIGCAFVVLLWLPSYFIIRNLNTWQLIINTLTTIITFLLVALLQNSQRRSEQAVHLKLDALADGLADLVSRIGGNRDGGDGFGSDVDRLRAAVGAEQARD